MRLSATGWLLFGGLLFAGLALAPASARPAQERSLSGTLEVIWRETGDGSPCLPTYRVASADGSRTTLSADGAPGSFLERVGRSVTILGDYAAPRAASPESLFQARAVVSDDLALAANEAESQIAGGPKPYLTILCRFAGKRQTPKPASYFKRLMSDPRDGLSSYFRRISYGSLSLEGSACVGWVDLPRPLTAYRPGPDFDLDLALEDAAALAGRQVSIGDFSGINVVFNVPAFGASIGGYGGRVSLDVPGGAKSYGVTWLSYVDHALFAHEIGHTLGLPHSSGPYGKTYDSDWDVMSQSYVTRSSKFGYLAQDTIAYHKRLLGWIPASGMRQVGPGQAEIAPLRPLCHTGGCQLIQIPIGTDGTRWYTVEARLRSGPDKRVPGEGVLIHLVDTKRGDRIAEVVDVDRNGNPNDNASLWTPGERFQDGANAVSVNVLSRNGDEYRIEVRNKS